MDTIVKRAAANLHRCMGPFLCNGRRDSRGVVENMIEGNRGRPEGWGDGA